MNTKITAQFESPEQAVEAAQRVRRNFYSRAYRRTLQFIKT